MENLGLIISISGGVFTIVAAMVAMMLWVRGEANADRRDIVNLIIAIKEDAHAFSEKMAQEMKDFRNSYSEQEWQYLCRNKDFLREFLLDLKKTGKIAREILGPRERKLLTA